MSAYPNTRALQIVPSEEPVVPSHIPTGAIPWPTILVEGGEKSGKSFELALFTGCGEFSKAWWIEVGMEGTAEQYKLVPGADYHVVDQHDGALPKIMDRLADIHRHAVWTNATGRKPILVAVDSAGAIWKSIQAWVDWRARNTKNARALLQQNPNAEIKAPFNIRNDGTVMWNKFIEALNAIPAVKVITSRGQEVTKFENNQPTTEKGWSVVGHKEMGFDVDIWVRLARSKPAEIIGIRSVVNGIRPDDDAFKPELVRRKDFSLRWLVFDRYGLAPGSATVRTMQNTDDARLIDPTAVDQPDEAEDARQQARFSDDVITDAAHLLDDARKCTDKTAFLALWNEAKEKSWAQVPLADGLLLDLLKVEATRVKEIASQQQAGEPAAQAEPEVAAATPIKGPSYQRQSELTDLMNKLLVAEHDQMALLSGLAGRRVTKLQDLGGESRDLVLNELQNLAAFDRKSAVKQIVAIQAEGGVILSKASA